MAHGRNRRPRVNSLELLREPAVDRLKKRRRFAAERGWQHAVPMAKLAALPSDPAVLGMQQASQDRVDAVGTYQHVATLLYFGAVGQSEARRDAVAS